MKSRLFVPALLVLIALGVGGYFLMSPVRHVPAIGVAVGSKFGGGTSYLPAVNGYTGSGASYSSGAGQDYQIDETYRVIATAKGHFAVMAHSVIRQDGNSIAVDRLLPVWDKKPVEAQRAEIDRQLFACAYLSENQLTY